MQWIQPTNQIRNNIQDTQPQDADYNLIMGNNDAYHPKYTISMQANSERMSMHLIHKLRLQPHGHQDVVRDAGKLNDGDIIARAQAHGLPVLVSIDGSYNKQQATTAITIIAPDIRPDDIAQEWEDRVGIVLLVRSILLPIQWGTNEVSINIAEAYGFLLAEYTIPINCPVIYITDSQNARGMHYNIIHRDSLTHRQRIRQLGQGISQSLVNHFEHLIQQRPAIEEFDEETVGRIEKGRIACIRWATNT
jgi:hypothetical protein